MKPAKEKNDSQAKKNIPRILAKIKESIMKSSAMTWGKGTGGNYPWRKK